MLGQARVFCTALLLLTTSTAPAIATDPTGGTGGGPINGILSIQVIHDGSTEPYPGAFVMVGPAPGDPIVENFGFTSATGEIVFSDPDLIGPVTVTVGAVDHRYFSLIGVDASELVIPLRPILPAGPAHEVGDFVSGIDVDNGPFHAGDGNVDMAFVLPALSLSDLISFDMGSLLGPPEIVEILGNPFEVPSNFFIPQQWELFVEIIKDHYYLYLPTGDYTLTAMSGRIPTDVLLGGGDIGDLLPAFQWREIDILDVHVAGDTYAADLNVDPDLTQTVTLNLANIPDGSLAFCISAGDLDNRTGLGRLVPLGLTSLDCPTGTGPCAGAVGLTTTAATGEFAGMAYFPAVAVDRIDTDDMLVVIDRTGYGQTYSADMSSFFDLLDLSHAQASFSWNDVESPANGSPDVDVQIARVGDAGTEAVYWEVMLPGERLGFDIPFLPPEAPPAPVEGVGYIWEQAALGLGYDLPAFDFDAFAFSDILTHGTHVALDDEAIVFGYPPVGIGEPDTETQGLSLRSVQPNPFTAGTTIMYRLGEDAVVDLSIFGIDGRRVATLTHGPIPAGLHAVDWSGVDGHGRPVASGLYVVNLRAGASRVTQSLLVLR